MTTPAAISNRNFTSALSGIMNGSVEISLNMRELVKRRYNPAAVRDRKCEYTVACENKSAVLHCNVIAAAQAAIADKK